MLKNQVTYAKCKALGMSCWRIRQRVKPTENAVNPSMLDQRIYLVFQKYNAQCNSGLTNFVLLQVCFFPLALFLHHRQIHQSVLYNTFPHYIDFPLLLQSRSNIKGDSASSLLYFVFQEILVRQVICGM